MATDFRSVNVACPFYITEDYSNIICEGLYPKSRVIMSFSGGKAKEHHQSRFCFGYPTCKGCSLCSALYSKYDVL